MTYWYHAYCQDCKLCSPSLFVQFNTTVSLYPLDDGAKERAGEWLDDHASPGHDVRLVHENDQNKVGKPKFPPANDKERN